MGQTKRWGTIEARGKDDREGIERPETTCVGLGERNEAREYPGEERRDAKCEIGWVMRGSQ